MKRHDATLTTRLDFQRLSPELVAAAAKLPTATLHEAGKKIGALPSAIKPVAPQFRCAGSALTVHSPGGDNLWLHRALDIAQAGDVMVVFANGAHEHGYWGEIMATMAQARGLADGGGCAQCVAVEGVQAHVGANVAQRPHQFRVARQQ